MVPTGKGRPVMKKFVLAASLGCGLGIWAAIQLTGPVLAQSNADKTSVYEQLDLFGDIFECQTAASKPKNFLNFFSNSPVRPISGNKISD